MRDRVLAAEKCMELQQLDERERLMSSNMADDSASEGRGPAVANGAVNGSAAHDADQRTGKAAEPDFLCGVALSVYQNSGGAGTNWEAFEDQRSLFMPRIAVGSLCVACHAPACVARTS